MPDNLKLLIVDDDKFLVDMYSIKFSESGFDVETAESGEEALRKIDQGLVPDICLVDVIMFGMSGFDLLAEMKKNSGLSKTTFIVLSNLGQQEDIDKGISLGADGYIIKASSTPTEVVGKVCEIFKNKNPN